ncbi:MAG: hypothetical protein QOF39_1109 [Frankiales bacterium]|nr:hypothetical protein [Frankiales bacterium]
MPTPVTVTTPVTREPAAGVLMCAAGGSPTCTVTGRLIARTPLPVRIRTCSECDPYRLVVSQENVSVQPASSSEHDFCALYLPST